MKRILYFLIAGTFLISVFVVLTLYYISDRMAYAKNSFIRQFPPHPVIFVKGLDLHYNSWYIAGGTASHIFLANITSPVKLLKIDNRSGDTAAVKLRIDPVEKLNRNASRLSVDSTAIYLLDGFSAKILKGKPSDLKLNPYVNNDNFFMDAVPMKNGAFALRSLAVKSQQYVLARTSAQIRQVDIIEINLSSWMIS